MATKDKKVVRKDRSPMNPKIWVLQLECGHDVYRKPPLKKSYPCDRKDCSGGPK